MIPALVLTAGLATRLQPLSLVRSKAAFPVAGTPLIHRILRSLAACGVTDVVLNLHHLPHTLTAVVGDGADLGMRVRYSWEVPLLGSAGGPRRAIPILGASRLLIINGDTLSNMDLGALVEHHQRSGALVTMGVVPNTKPEKYRGLLVGADDIVTGFGFAQPSSHFTFAQVVEAAAFDSVPAGVPYESVNALYPALIAAQRGSVRAYRSDAVYDDIGTRSDYLETSLRLAELEGRALALGHGAWIDPTARVERSVLWDHAVVEAGAMLRECVVTDGVRVPADSSWHGVTMRLATSALVPGEKRIGEIAVADLKWITDPRVRIDQFLREQGWDGPGVSVVPLTSDASDRRYFRVLFRDEPSRVLAVHPGEIDFDGLPFVNVARLLEQMPVPVPTILGHSNPLGIVALQDLGDVTLQAHLGAASRAEHSALYRQAVVLIETLQRRGIELASPSYVPYSVAFDVEKLTWELQFFAKHFLEAYRGATLTSAHRDALAEEFMAIAAELAAEPAVLCHRDYHSRNLMLHNGTLHIIDFQDARLGPDTYDLASLLRDSYVELSESQVEELVAFFLAMRGSRADRPVADEQQFRTRFDLMSLQRNLKALGTFGFQTTSRGNTVYIQYIPRTLSYARANLERYPRFSRLRQLLAEHLEELR